MRLDEAEKILNKNGYELINEDFASFLGSGNPLAGIICFFLVVIISRWFVWCDIWTWYRY
jgi:uncharacterized membrane protein